MDPYDKSIDIAKPRRPWLRWLKRIGWSLLALMVLAFGAQRWWHYTIQKRLDEALAELDRTEPGWRLEDIEAAREQIPEEENSARVVVAAAKLLPKNWPTPEFADLFAHLPPEEELAPEDFARLKQELENVRPALKEARKLAGMPRGRHSITYERNIFATLLPGQGEVGRIARLLAFDAFRHDQESDLRSAIISCRAAFNAGHSIGDEPLCVTQMIRLRVTFSACQSVERALAQGPPPSEEMVAFQRLLSEEDAFPTLLVSARGERAAQNEWMDAIESGDISLSNLIRRRPDWQEPDWQVRILGFHYRDKILKEHPFLLAMMSRWVALAQLPSSEQRSAQQALEQEIRNLPEQAIWTRPVMTAMSKVSKDSRRNHGYLRSLIVALAAERYRRERGAWPDTIEKLCPKYLTAVPLDPFDGQPLRYRRLDDGVVIYSVGHDAVDNDGNLDREHPNQPGVDIGCRLWDVAKRRQPPRPKPPAEMPDGPVPNPG